MLRPSSRRYDTMFTITHICRMKPYTCTYGVSHIHIGYKTANCANIRRIVFITKVTPPSPLQRRMRLQVCTLLALVILCHLFTQANGQARSLTSGKLRRRHGTWPRLRTHAHTYAWQRPHACLRRGTYVHAECHNYPYARAKRH